MWSVPSLSLSLLHPPYTRRHGKGGGEKGQKCKNDFPPTKKEERRREEIWHNDGVGVKGGNPGKVLSFFVFYLLFFFFNSRYGKNGGSR